MSPLDDPAHPNTVTPASAFSKSDQHRPTMTSQHITHERLPSRAPFERARAPPRKRPAAPLIERTVGGDDERFIGSVTRPPPRIGWGQDGMIQSRTTASTTSGWGNAATTPDGENSSPCRTQWASARPQLHAQRRLRLRRSTPIGPGRDHHGRTRMPPPNTIDFSILRSGLVPPPDAASAGVVACRLGILVMVSE